jgi:hypothetical protein
MTGFGNEIEDDPRKVKTNPNTPRNDGDISGFDKH